MRDQLRLEPLPRVLLVAAGLTRAKNALRPGIMYAGVDPVLRHAQALGNLAYAMEPYWLAVEELRSKGHRFDNMEVDTPYGLMAEAMSQLRSDNDSVCAMWVALGLLAQAHTKLARFHYSQGYRKITDEDLENIVLGVGGGR